MRAGSLTLAAGVPSVAGAFLALAAALALLFARSWRIDQPYSIDFRVYHAAGVKVASHQAAALYDPQEIDDSGQRLALPAHEFKNVPLVAGLFAPLAALPYLEAKRVFWFVSLGALCAAGWMTGRSIARLSGRTDAVLPACATALLLASAPAHIALRHGQLTPLALLGLAGFLTLSASRREGAAGGALAAACVLKLPLLALPVRDILRRRWARLAGFAAVAAGAAALSVALFGWPLHAAFLGHIAENARTGISGHNNQSLEGVFQRLLAAGGLQDWTPRPEVLAVSVARGAVGLALAALLATAMWRAGGAEDFRRFALEAVGFLCLGLLASPVSWDHYFLFAVAGLPWFAWAASGSDVRLAWAGGLLCGALLVIPTPTPLLEEGGAPGVLSQLAVSHYAAGAAALLLFSSAALARGVTRTT